jgi:outer membrane protein assembly factor BamB
MKFKSLFHNCFIFFIYSCFFPIFALDIGLSVGWNLVTVPVSSPQPVYNFLSGKLYVDGIIRTDVDNIVARIWSYDGSWLSYSNGSGELTEFKSNLGYWFYMKKAAVLRIADDSFLISNIKMERSGWHLIGVGNKSPLSFANDVLHENFISTDHVPENIKKVWGYRSGWEYFVTYPAKFGMSNLNPGFGYWFYVQNHDDHNVSKENPLIITPPGLSWVLTFPGYEQITVSWSPVSGASAYRIYSSTSPAISTTGLFFTVSADDGNSTLITGLENGKTIYFRVQAVYADGKADSLSKEVSASPVHLKWSVQTGGEVYSSPAIGADGTVYVGSSDKKLYAINSDGTIKWSMSTTGNTVGGVYSSPAIGSDGVIYVGGLNNRLYAVNSDGKNKWSFGVGDKIYSSPAIGWHGDIYIGSDDKKLYAVNLDGTQKWSFETGGAIRSSPAVGPDETVYVGSNDHRLYALNPDGTEKWSFITGGPVTSSPAIDQSGIIYVGSEDKKLYAFNSDGTEKWFFPTGGLIKSSPVLDSDGTIYIGSDDNNIYAINPDGTEKWVFMTGGRVRATPAIGANGVIYVGSYGGNFYAINADGTCKWSFANIVWPDSSPVISSDGFIYTGGQRNQLYAFFDGVTGLRDSSWPSFRGRSLNEGRQPFRINLASDSIAINYMEAGEDMNYRLYLHSSDLSDYASAAISSDICTFPYLYSDLLEGERYYGWLVADEKNQNRPLLEFVARPAIPVPENIKTERMALGDFYITWDEVPDASIYSLQLTTTFAVSMAQWVSHYTTQNSYFITELPPENNFYVRIRACNEKACSDFHQTSLLSTSVYKWSFDEGRGNYYHPALGRDGSVYVKNYDGNLYAINSDGTEKWRFSINNLAYVYPVIGQDDTIYIRGWPENIYAINPDGTEKWRFYIGSDWGQISPSPAVDLTGVIYVGGNDNKLYAINPDGTAKWSFAIGYSWSRVISTPVIDSDGTIYVFGDNKIFYAIYPDGTEKWSVQLTGYSPVIGIDGTIYVSSSGGVLYAINPDSTIKWIFTTGEDKELIYSVIATDGTIYVGEFSGKLYAINPDGTKKWDFETVPFWEGMRSPPAIDSDGTIYTTSLRRMHAINPDGSEKWSFELGGMVNSAPVIGVDGTVYAGSYLGSFQSKLYAFHSYSASLQKSAWPSYGNDAGNRSAQKFKIIKNHNSATFYNAVRIEEGSYHLYLHKENLSDYTQAAIVVNNLTFPYTQSGLQTGSTYYGWLVWRNPDGQQDLQQSFIITPSLPAPENIVVQQVGFNSIQVSWNETAFASVYRILVSTGTSEPLSQWDAYETGQNSLIVSGLAPKQKYYIRVLACDGEFCSDFRQTLEITTSPLKWSFPVARNFKGSVAVGADGTVYVGNEDGNLYAINSDGSERWSFPVDLGWSWSSPAIDQNGIIYVGNYNKRLYALNPDGTEKWSFLTEGPIQSSPAIDTNGSVYFGSDDGRVYALDSEGFLKWSFQTGGQVISSPAIDYSGTIYIGSADSKIYALKPDGGLKWSFLTGGGVCSSPALDSDGAVYFGSGDNKLYAINPDGSLKWFFMTGGPIRSSPVIDSDGTVYVGGLDKKLYAIDRDGVEKWSFLMENSMFSAPAIGSDGIIYAGNSKFHALNPDGSEKWFFDIGSDSYSSPVIGGNGVIYTYNHQVIYAFYTTGSSSRKSAWLAFGNDFSLNSEQRFQISENYDSVNINYKEALEGDSYSLYLHREDLSDYSQSEIIAEGIDFPYVQSGLQPSVLYYGWLVRKHSEGDRELLQQFQVRPSLPSPVNIEFKQLDADSFQLSWDKVSNSSVYRIMVTTNMFTPVSQWEYTEVDRNSFLLTGINFSDFDYYIRVLACDIGLACSHDGQRIIINKYKWHFAISGDINSSPAIASDGTIYIGGDYHRVYALNPDGTQKWTFVTGGAVRSSPSVAGDGTIYFGSSDCMVYALNPDGTQKWTFATEGEVNSSPAIDSDGTIYIGCDDYKIYALNPDGSQKWSFLTGGEIYSSPVIGTDGTIYIGSNDYRLYALNPDGSQKWFFETHGSIISSPAIGADGTIYIGSHDKKFYAINQDGTVKWFFLTERMISHTPVIDREGTVYLSSDALYALNSDGTEKWAVPFSIGCNSSAAIGLDGVIYIKTVYDGFYELDRNGENRKKLLPDSSHINSSPVISSDGTLYAAIGYGKFYALRTVGMGVQKSAWPLFRHDSMNRGRQLFNIVQNIDIVVVSYSDSVETGSYHLYQDSSDLSDYNQAEVILNNLTFPHHQSGLQKNRDNYGWLVWNNAVNGSELLLQFKLKPSLPAPANIEFERINSGIFRVEWDEVIGASSYKVLISTDNSLPMNQWDYYETIQTSHLIVAQDYNDYFVRVLAYYGGDVYSDFSQTKFIARYKWSFLTDGRIGASSPAVDEGGNIYIGSYDKKLYALQPDGSKKWTFTTGGIIYSSPAVSVDGSVYVGSSDGKFYAINPDGSERWVTNIGSELGSSSAIDSEGTIYIFAIDSRLYAIDQDGGIKWSFPVGTGNSIVFSSPAIGADGTIYSGGNANKLYAINPDGTERWAFDTGGSIHSSPAIDNDGTIYFGCDDGKLYAVSSDGTQKWIFNAGFTVRSSPVIGPDGTIYLGAEQKLYAINPDGIEKWHFLAYGQLQSSPAIDANGVIYVGTLGRKFYAINSDGTEKWVFDAGDIFSSSPVISSTGVVYVGNYDKRIYAIDSFSGGRAQAIWPAFGLNSSNRRSIYSSK